MAAPALPPAVLNELISEARNTAMSRYNTLAMTVLYVYDLVTTLDKEVDLVWNRPWSFLKVLYIINRCLALLEGLFNSSVFLYQGTNLSNSLCGNWFKFQSGTALVLLVVVQTILVTRLWAMYEHNRPILISMSVFGTLQIIASATIMFKSLRYSPALAQPAPGFVVCSMILPPYFAAYWLPILAFETTLLVLMLIKGWHNFRQQNVTVVSGMTGQRLGNLLVRDSIIYFVVINAVYLANAVVWYRGAPILAEAALPYGILLPPLMAGKLLLNLRDAFYRGSGREERSTELTTFRAPAPRLEPSNRGTTSRSAVSRSQSQWEEWERGNPSEW